jgi:hypothetical protein
MDLQEEPKAKKQTILPTYIPTQPFYRAGVVGLQSAGVGLLVSAVQNTLNRHSAGAAGVFTRTGGTITFFGEDWTGLLGRLALELTCTTFSCYGWNIRIHRYHVGQSPRKE